MATTVVKTIGTGGDYTTLQAWEDASPADLVAADQIWEGQLTESITFTGANNLVTFAGSTSNASCYKHLTTAPGMSFVDNADKLTNALRFNKANGLWIESTNGKYGSATIIFTELFATVSNLQLSFTSGQASSMIGGSGNTILGQPKGTLRNCIVVSNGTDSTINKVDAYNCLIETNGTTPVSLCYFGDATNIIQYCTLVAPIGVPCSGAFLGNYAYLRQVKDCAAFTNGGYFTSGSGITVENCFSDSAQVLPGLTTVTYDTSTGSGFENISAGTEDFRIKATSTLVDAGASIPELPYDIVGTLRGAPPDVGCWEYTDQGGAVDHHTSGSIIGSGADTTGSADHRPTSVTHSSGGNIVGKTSDVTGASSSFSKLTSSGALLGDFGTVTGTSTRFRAHPAVGALLGDFGTVTGAADQSSPVGEHDVEGDIVAGTGTVTGQSHSVGYRPTTGAIVGNTGVIAGTAKHIKMHATHGDPIGAGSIVVGTASRSDPVVDHSTFGEIDGYQANLFGNATHSKMTLTQADIDAIVAGIVAAIIPVNIVKVNSIDVDGTGADSDPWGPV